MEKNDYESGEREKFGFGFMRMPVLDAGKPDSFDYKKIEELFDTFLEQVAGKFENNGFFPTRTKD